MDSIKNKIFDEELVIIKELLTPLLLLKYFSDKIIGYEKYARQWTSVLCLILGDPKDEAAEVN